MVRVLKILGVKDWLLLLVSIALFLVLFLKPKNVSRSEVKTVVIYERKLRTEDEVIKDVLSSPILDDWQRDSLIAEYERRLGLPRTIETD